MTQRFAPEQLSTFAYLDLVHIVVASRDKTAGKEGTVSIFHFSTKFSLFASPRENCSFNSRNLSSRNSVTRKNS